MPETSRSVTCGSGDRTRILPPPKYLCHLCGKLFSSFSLDLHTRSCRRKKGKQGLAAPPDLSPTPACRLEYNAWAANILLNKDILLPCPLCGLCVLPNRISAHLWKCRQRCPSILDESSLEIAVTVGVPANPYEQSGFLGIPLRRQERREEKKETALVDCGTPSQSGNRDTRRHADDQTRSPTAEVERKAAFASCERGGGTGARRLRQIDMARSLSFCRRGPVHMCGSRPASRTRLLREYAAEEELQANRTLLFWQRKGAAEYLRWINRSPALAE
ncbi:hypothetical protein CSUI_010044 [Cystoisospora suis]|uniref:Uncharacterized protein n=1 Tax=Cystoisospora suis TaxID=483139 RepID=A0A2C6KIC2_9APIC|nr:hypothetical protein CSUI_010044 [Cystoisospora suis]